MNDLDTTLKEITLALIKDFIFYFSVKRLVKDEEITPEMGKFLSFSNKIILIDLETPFIIDPNNNQITNVVLKNSKLTSNTVKILGIKNSQNEETFNYIGSKYLDQVRLYKQVSDLLVAYYETDCPIKNSSIKSVFSIQNKNLTTHLSEIEKILNVKPVILTSNELVNFVRNDKTIKSLNFNDKVKDDVVIDTNSKTDIEEEKKYLRDYILDIDENNRIEIEKIIVKKFGDRKGKTIRYVLESLSDLNLLKFTDQGKKTLILKSLENSFNNKNSKFKSVFGFDVDKVNNKNFKSVKLEVNLHLKDYI